MMPKAKTHSEISPPQIQLAQHPDTAPPPQERFQTWLSKTLNETNAHQVKYVNRSFRNMTANDYVGMIEKDVDFAHTEATDPKQFARDIQSYQQEFHETVGNAKTVEELFKNCDRYVQDEQAHLFYLTNDIASARIKQDYFNEFVDRLLPVLKADNMLSADMEKQFANLKEGYKFGFEAYEGLRADVTEYTGGEYKGLIAAASKQMKITPSTNIDRAISQLEQKTHETSRNIMLDFYAVEHEPDTAVPPLLFGVMRLADTLARSKMRNAHKGIDLADPHAPALDSKFSSYAEPIVNKILDATEQDESPARYAVIARDLKRDILKEENLPDNFSALVAQAASDASKHTLKNAALYHAQDRDRLKLYLREGRAPRSYTMTQTLLEGQDTKQRVELDIKNLVAETPVLSQSFSKDSLLQTMYNLATTATEEGMFGFNHPALMLATKDFFSQFRKNLSHELDKAGCSDPTLNQEMKEIEKYAERAYQSRNVAGDWLMQQTNNGSEHLFELACLQQGWDPRTLKESDIQDTMMVAKGTLHILSEKRGIPEALCDNPFTPLIYEQCHAIAQAELAQELKDGLAQKAKKPEQAEKQGNWRTRTGFKPRNYKTTAEDPLKKEAAAQQAETDNAMQEKIVNKMAINVMNDALARITFIPEPQDSKTSEAPVEKDDTIKPHMTPHNVAILFDYLDARERSVAPRAATGISFH